MPYAAAESQLSNGRKGCQGSGATGTAGKGGSLSLRQGTLFCQEQPSPPEKEPGKIYKAL